jgi:4-diphosphocytidyl-2-C-methyl-D-erythritol kinase
MLLFPSAKINIGLNVISKRDDGFHNIESIFYPINFYDCLEIIENPNIEGDYVFYNHGLKIDGNPEDNLVVKAIKLVKQQIYVPKLEVHLLKNIAFGAGLGGGSADAASMLKYLFNTKAQNAKELESLAEKLGSDCVFFLHNKAMYAEGKGEILREIPLSLKLYTLLLIIPPIHISTKEAYSELRMVNEKLKIKNVKPLEKLNVKDISNWKGYVKNDFEDAVFPKYPVLAEIKENLYKIGAIYASMSGSGSAIYGIFEKTDRHTLENIQNFLKKKFDNFTLKKIDLI